MEGMYTPAMLSYWLGGAVTNTRYGQVEPCCHGGIKLLDQEDSKLRPECLYLGTSQSVTHAVSADRLPSDGIFFISSGVCELANPPDNLTLFETDLPLLELYNRVHEHIHRFLAWDASLHEVIYKNAGLQELLQRASTEIQATLLLMNTGYKHIASVCDPEVKDPIAEELCLNGYQSFSTIQAVRKEVPLRQDPTGTSSEYISQQSNNYTIVRKIRYQGNLVARLCVILNGPEANPCYSDLCAILASYIAEYMFSNQGVNYGSNAAFGSLAADLIECRLTDPEELEQRLKQIKLAVHRYYHVIIVAFESGQSRESIPWNYIISQLEQVFPFSNITTYHGEILMIVRKTKRGSRMPFDREKLLSILERYNGYASIGNTSEFLSSLPPMYHQTRDALRFGRVMDPDRRILYYEDYSIYQIIELAAESARCNMGTRNLIHLCNTETVTLLIHDNKTGGNLLEFLHVYLLHDRNVTETARAFYIHRNTALYKIHKIEEIIGSSLDDPILRERLLFSYHVLEYMTRYCKEDILTLKRTRSEDYPDNSGR